MRRLFADYLLSVMKDNKNIVLITADMGYGLWDAVKANHPDRFFNVGSAEQLMIGCAAGMAMEGKIPVCYSITPFALYRPFEFVRNFMQFEVLPIKLVGGGRGTDYGYLGYTHHDFHDEDILRNFKNISVFKPLPEEELTPIFSAFLNFVGPSYLNLVK